MARRETETLPHEVPLVRIFLSSPGDVAEERTLARQFIDSELPKFPQFREKVKFELIAWDDPAARIPMLATETPQESVNAARPRPANCDIVIVILWSRMGTPLHSVRKPNDEPYLSGTEWEYEDAVKSPQQPPPTVLVYRRTEEPKGGLGDPELTDKQAQFQRVGAFFAQFRNDDGSLKGGINEYAMPSEFKTQLSQHLQEIVWQRLQNDMAGKPGSVLITQFMDGLQRLHSYYTRNIQDFFDTYLGSSLVRVPFGGRKKQLDFLDQWADDDGDSPYLLLTAPAARGKSALLTRWTQRLTERPGHYIVFVPISIRFETNLPSVYFSIIAARLAEIFNEKVFPSIVDTPADVWRRMVMSFLTRPVPAGRKLILILDGADESADIGTLRNLFPVRPPQNFRVVVSARFLAGDPGAGPWLVRLGWEGPSVRAKTLDLPALNQEDVAHILHEMGAPLEELAHNVNITHQLYRLSKGDPLLINLYVNDLWKRGEGAVRLRAEDLETLRPGLSGYLTDYLDRLKLDQQLLWGKENPLALKNVRFILDLLSCALGPLRLDDIQHLAPPHSALHSHDIIDSLRYVSRLILGDGRQQGFVFSHSLIGEYYYNELSTQDKHYYESLFRNWADWTLNGLNNGHITPDDVSPYLVQFYGLHLRRTNASPHLLIRLVCKGWQQAWEALSKTYAGFLDDVDRAWNAVETLDTTLVMKNQASLISQEIRCALCTASINSLAGAIPPNLLRCLCQEALLTEEQALAYAYQTTDPWGRAQALLTLSRLLPMAKRGEAMRGILNAAWELRSQKDLFEEERDGHHKWLFEKAAELIKEVASQIPEFLIEEALDTANAIDNEWDRETAVKSLIPRLTEPLLEKALFNSFRMENEWGKARIIKALAPRLTDPMLEKASDAVWAMRYMSAWATGIAGLLPRLPSEMTDKAMERVGKLRTPDRRGYIMGELIDGLPSPLLETAMQVIRDVADDRVKGEAIAHFAHKISLLDDTDKALSIARVLLNTSQAITEPIWKADAWRALIVALPEVLLPDMVRVLQDFGRYSEFYCEEILNILIKRVPVSLIDSVVPIIFELSDYYKRKPLCLLAPRVVQKKSLLAILEILDGMGGQYEDIKGKVIEEMAHNLGEPLLSKAVEIAKGISSVEARLDALMALLPRLSVDVTEKELSAVLWAVRTHDNPRWQWRAFVKVTTLAPQESSLFEEAFNAARQIRVPSVRATELAELAAVLPRPLRMQALREALSAARVIGDGFFLVKTQKELGVLQSNPEWERLLPHADAIPESSSRFEMLMWLAPRLRESEKNKAIKQALTCISTLSGQASALEKIASFITSRELFESAVNVLNGISGDERNNALIVLVKALSSQLQDEMFANILKMRDENAKARIFRSIGAHLPAHLSTQVITHALQFSSIGDSISAIGDLMRSMPPSMVETLRRSAMHAASPAECAVALTNVIAYVEPCDRIEVASKAIGAIRALSDNEQSRAMEALIPCLPDELLGEALSVINDYETHIYKLDSLEAISVRLPLLLISKAIDVAKAIPESEDIWGRSLAAVLDRLSELGDLDQAISIARNTGCSCWRFTAISAISKHLPTDLVSEALQIAETLDEQEERDEARATILERLVVLGGASSAMDKAMSIKDPYYRAKALVSAFNQLPPDRTCETAGMVLSEVSHVPEINYKYTAPNVCHWWGTNKWKAEALCQLSQRLPAVLLGTAIDIALGVGLASDKAGAIKKLCARMHELSRTDRYAIWKNCLRTLANGRRETFLTGLMSLVCLVEDLGGDKCVTKTRREIEEIATWWP